MTAPEFLELAISVTLQAALLVIATSWLNRTTRSEALRGRLWTTCYLLLLLLVLNATALPHLRLTQPLQILSRRSTVTLLIAEQSLGNLLLAIWIAGLICQLGQLVRQCLQASRLLRICSPIAPVDLPLTRLNTESPLPTIRQQPVRFLQSTGLASPFCWHFHQPCIVIPDSLLHGNPEQLNLILRHELAHLQIGHPLHVFLQRAVEILFWFHPLIRWSSRQWSLSREFQCDEVAVTTPEEIIQYLKTLLTIAEQHTGKQPSIAAPAMLRHGSELVRRSQRLIQRAQSNDPASIRTAIFPGDERRILSALVAVFLLVTALVWAPVNAVASPGSVMSPWPAWTARILHDFGVNVRDFELNDYRYTLHELQDSRPAAPAASMP